MNALRSIADWFADVQGFWLSAFMVSVWALLSAANDPTILLPYDRCVIHVGATIGILRLIYLGVQARAIQSERAEA